MRRASTACITGSPGSRPPSIGGRCSRDVVREQMVLGEVGEVRRRIVGIGELEVSDWADEIIVTHALGSCVAVCIHDPVARVSAMLHFMLPESRINTERAKQQPATFADTGIPLLFQTAYRFGLEKRRAIVKLVGGAEITPAVDSAFRT